MNNSSLSVVLQQMGDDVLILGQRLCEWSGHAPAVELDISLSNLALDLIGQANMLLDYAGTVEAAGRDADALAFHRGDHEFRNALMVEQPNGDFGQTMLRHFFFATYALALYRELAQSSDHQIAAIAEKANKELRYHAEYSAEWVIRLGDGTPESHGRMTKALDCLWRFIDDLFAEDAAWSEQAKAGVVPWRHALRPEFDARVAEVLAQASLDMPEKAWPITGGRDGAHSEHLSRLLGEMQVLARAHPGAQW
jgi:ring-1,2-phenylacetyl-CoA epoxidase subunit PaaC